MALDSAYMELDMKDLKRCNLCYTSEVKVNCEVCEELICTVCFHLCGGPKEGIEQKKDLTPKVKQTDKQKALEELNTLPQTVHVCSRIDARFLIFQHHGIWVLGIWSVGNPGNRPYEIVDHKLTSCMACGLELDKPIMYN